MSAGTGSSSWHDIYGPPSGDRDRHIQSIIDHTSNIFPEGQSQLPQIFTTLGNSPSTELSRDGLRATQGYDTEYVRLDDFDRQVLGRPQIAYYPSSVGSFSDAAVPGQRLSLPPSTSVSRPPRILGDASHHFRPFVPKDPERRSPFQSNPHHLRQPRGCGLSHSIPGNQRYLESPPTAVQYSSPRDLQGPPRLDHPPQSLFNQDNVNGNGESQNNTQLFASSSHSAKTTPPVYSSLTSSSPSNAGHSSPSARVSRERQRQIAQRNQQVAKWNQKFQLDLEHASNLPPIVNNTRLIDPRQALPDKLRSIFTFPLFNVVQSKCFPLVYDTNDNVVISAPTGSGKTVILELAICKLVASHGADNFKIVYQAPTKSLCSEKAREWQKKFSHMNLQCIELTGDTSQADAHRVGSASIIVTTPEKWDSITRKWKDHRKLLDLVRLVLIDEVHILKDTRGATLEAVVSRMKTIGASIRFVAISATVPNIDDVAKWLGRDSQNQHEPARYEVFGEELRPIKLQRYVYGYDGASNDFCFEKTLDGKLNLLLAKHSQGKPIMVFCFTRKSCERTARALAEWWTTCQANDRAWPAPAGRVPVISQDLGELVRYGVAFHHAGLDAQDRASVEMNFLKGQLHVICCTSTLAVGVNLPCHTVVIKGTRHYTDDGPQEYSDLEVMQMLGRAGRPQFDNSATAVIMTRLANVERYEKLVSGKELLESTLHRNLLEHLNSEIGLGTIQDTQTAKKWISGTFLSVRVRQSPALYNLEEVNDAAGADERMEEWCERDVKLLQDNELVTKCTPFTCTEYGQAMSRYMVPFETMKLILAIPRAATGEEILAAICKAPEFKDFRFKPAERTIFRELNKSPLILYPIRETLTLAWHKIFMMVQITLGGVEMPTDAEGKMFRQDFLREKRVVLDRLRRFVRCVIDCKAADCDGHGIKAALELYRSICAHAWENKPAQLSQIKGFGPVAVRKWISHGVLTVLGVADRSTIDIERIASRNPPYGRTLQKQLEDFPRLSLKAEVVESGARNRHASDAVSVSIKVHLGHNNSKPVPSWNDRAPALTFLALRSDGHLAYFWHGNMRQVGKSGGIDLKFPVLLSAPKQVISCHFSCEEIVGTQVMKSLEPNIPASVFGDMTKPATVEADASNVEVSKRDAATNEADYEGISDEAMLEALKSPINSFGDDYSDNSDDEREDFPHIDEILSEEYPLPGQEPARMANGRYVCNHRCGNGGLTKSGKPCSHACCHEGVDKYRPPKKVGKSSLSGSAHQSEDHGERPGNIQISHQGKRHDPKKRKHDTSTPTLDISNRKLATKRKDTNNPTSPSRVSKKKRELTPTGASGHNIRTPKRPRREHSSRTPHIPSDMEHIDLCDESDEASLLLVTRKPHTNAAQRQRQRLLILDEEVNGHRVGSPRLTKSYKEKAKTHIGDTNKVDSCNEGAVPRGSPSEKREFPQVDDVFYDVDDDLSDLPEIETLLFAQDKNCKQGSSSRPASPQIGFTSDETLYPVDELQKASERLGLPSVGDEASTHKSAVESPQALTTYAETSPLPELLVTEPHHDDGISLAEVENRYLPDEPHVNGDACPIDTELQHVEENESSFTDNTANASGPTEPAWLNEFDPELIGDLRGAVNFID
ncbi:P-loop containing nucleoside triphosphate hydrolase protein [Poronia punctata]|nr:P-loop containing nucleoside triphosphate hydrolase protein [Poronia punctata]